MTSPAILAAFETLVQAIRADVRQELLSLLGGGGQPAPLSLSRPTRQRRRGETIARAKARPKGAKRTANEIDELIGHTLKFIKANPGSRSEQIAEGLGVSTKDLVLPISKLFEAKALKSTGQRRGTKYTAK